MLSVALFFRGIWGLCRREELRISHAIILSACARDAWPRARSWHNLQLVVSNRWFRPLTPAIIGHEWPIAIKPFRHVYDPPENRLLADFAVIFAKVPRRLRRNIRAKRATLLSLWGFAKKLLVTLSWKMLNPLSECRTEKFGNIWEDFLQHFGALLLALTLTICSIQFLEKSDSFLLFGTNFCCVCFLPSSCPVYH